MNLRAYKKEYFDIAVIGGGPAGMMAAISASQDGAKVVLIEKNANLGQKLMITGNGRCNITQAKYDNREFMQKIGKNGKFLFSALSAFGPKDTIEFFENLGLGIKVQKDGRVFPESNQAEDVIKILKSALDKNGTVVKFYQKVLGFEIKDKKVECAELSDGKIYAKCFILASGGKTYPATGSTGDGYHWLEKLGHKIISPSPALVPVKIKESWVKDLRGISLKNVGLKLIQKNRKVDLGAGEMVFTHFGLSGPSIINASKIIGEHLEKGEVFLELDLLPALNISALQEKLKIVFEMHKKINLKNYLSEFLPRRLALKIMELAGLGAERKIYSLSREERINLAKLLKGILVSVATLMDFNQAMITSGGACLKDIDPKTMRSKIISNLFLAGEVLDLDGPTGGYNLQIAWATGYTAGDSARSLLSSE